MTPPVQPSDIREYLDTVPEQEQAVTRLFGAGEPLTILDIGACEAEDSIRYARRFPHARIFAFEPLPENQLLISANLREHHAGSVELVPVALAEKTGTATFHVSSGRPKESITDKQWNYGNKSSSLLPPAAGDPMYGWVEFKETITVPTATLEDFCRERGIGRIDFIHMDVQGAELLVLEGAGPKLGDVTALWLEVADVPQYRGQPLRRQVGEFMRARGFRLAFEVRHASEGDQFYINLRHPRTWPWLLRLRAESFMQQARFNLGRWKNSCTDLLRRHLNPIRSLKFLLARLGLLICKKDHPAARYFQLRPVSGLNYALLRSFASLDRLRFIQVGANDGSRQDPIVGLIRDFKWSGILVEPREPFIQSLKIRYANNPDIRTVHAAITADCSRSTLYYIDPAISGLPDWTPGLATLDRNRIQSACRDLGLGLEAVLEETVPCLTWNKLLHDSGTEQTDVLVLDTEGFDVPLLNLWDWENQRPRVVHFEHACTTPDKYHDLQERLHRYGYESVSEGPDTTFFLPLKPA